VGKEKKSWYDKVRTSLEGNVQHSISQIRGVPHPLACAFLPDVPNTVAVVGWDIDGNGVLLQSDYSQEEAIRTAYHVLAKTKPENGDNETEGQRRRKIMLGGASPKTSQPQGEEGGAKLYVGERVEVLENQMREIRFEEDDGFLNVLRGGNDDDDDDNDKDAKEEEDKEDGGEDQFLDSSATESDAAR